MYVQLQKLMCNIMYGKEVYSDIIDPRAVYQPWRYAPHSVNISALGSIFCNQPPYHTLYVISYGNSEAQRVRKGSIRQPGQV